MATIEEIQTLVNVTVSFEKGKPIPLCQTHYKQVHRSLNTELYQHAKCHTCSATIRGPVRHCPDPVRITHHFSRRGNVDFVLTKDHTICTSCYTAHLEILEDSNTTSHDFELETLLGDISLT